MFNKKKLVKEEDLFDLLEQRDEIIKNKIEDSYEYANSIRKICYDEFEKLKEEIRKIKEREKRLYHYGEIESRYQYKIELPEEKIVYYFETEEVAEEFFKNEIQHEKSFKANKKMWDLIYKMGKNNENSELAEDEIDDE